MYFPQKIIIEHKTTSLHDRKLFELFWIPFRADSANRNRWVLVHHYYYHLSCVLTQRNSGHSQPFCYKCYEEISKAMWLLKLELQYGSSRSPTEKEIFWKITMAIRYHEQNIVNDYIFSVINSRLIMNKVFVNHNWNKTGLGVESNWNSFEIRSKFVRFDLKICDSIDSKRQKTFIKVNEN